MQKVIVSTMVLWSHFIAWEGSGNLAFSQSNNLYFNQVINQAVNSTGTCYTVPANKVFKLEGVIEIITIGSYLEFGSACGSIDYGRFYISNNTTHIGISAASGWQSEPFPMWFKEGVSIGTSASTVYIQGIEFNVAP